MTNIIGKLDLPITEGVGRQNISHLMEPGWSGTLSIQKIGPIVFLTGSGLRPPATGTVKLVNLPEEFVPTVTKMGEGVEGSAFRAVFIVDGAAQVRGIAAANSYVDLNVIFTV